MEYPTGTCPAMFDIRSLSLGHRICKSDQWHFDVLNFTSDRSESNKLAIRYVMMCDCWRLKGPQYVAGHYEHGLADIPPYNFASK